MEEGMFSAGILLTAPTPKLKTVTARDTVINLFSVKSPIGLIQKKSMPYIPAITHANPM